MTERVRKISEAYLTLTDRQKRMVKEAGNLDEFDSAEDIFTAYETLRPHVGSDPDLYFLGMNQEQWITTLAQLAVAYFDAA